MSNQLTLAGKRILVTGATGFLGRHLMPILVTRYGREKVCGVSSRDFDLMDPAQVRRMFSERKPQILVHLAAYSGGIGANRRYPADFYYRNTLLTALVFEAAARSGVEKMVYTVGGCSYPARAPSPLSERQMWDGYPQPESAAYSTAKKMGMVASEAYRRQHGLISTVLIPGNMYGEYDNFHPQDSHVVPAMLRRYYEAQRRGDQQVTMWGTGTPVRDFVYAGDVAAVIPWFLENFQETGPVNVSSGVATSIRELAETVAAVTGYCGEIVWDAAQPDGQKIKTFDVALLGSLGLSCPTSLREGLQRTARWFCAHYESRSDGIRL
jgi:GDP-L-fucose synthase